MRTRHSPRARTGLGVLFLLLAQPLALAPPAQAHGDTVKVVITGQREGHLTTDITWENDGDAIEEAVAATVNATSADGTRSVGPWKLVRDSGTRTGWSTAEALPPGTWKVHVNIGFPALGHAEREVSVPVVDPAPPSTSAAPTPPVPVPAPASPSTTAVPSAAASVQPAPASDGSTLSWATTGLAMAALAGAASGMLLVRRARSRRQPRGDG